ncbi:MAG: hypothetical protein V3T56_07840 [Gemmatimonadales bacterium]
MIGFHRFLIASAIVFCMGFAVWSLLAFEANGSVGTLVLGVVFVLAAIGLGFYLNNLDRFLKM